RPKSAPPPPAAAGAAAPGPRPRDVNRAGRERGVRRAGGRSRRRARLGWGGEGQAMAALLAPTVALGGLGAGGPALPPEHLARRALPPAVMLEGRLVEEPVRWAEDRVRLLLDVEAVYDGAERQPAAGRVQL